MARQTKQDLIDELQSRLGARVTEGDSLQTEINEEARRNHQLRDKLEEQRKKIDKLKGVARFYRAQRDRVDAYLSAMIDAAELQVRPTMDLGLDVYEGKHTAIADSEPKLSPPAYRHRPRIQEPSVRLGGIESDGRDFAAYRDDEPEAWEDF